MNHGPPPSDSEEDYDGFDVNFVGDDDPPPAPLVGLEERNQFFQKLQRSLHSGHLALLDECFNDEEYLINVNVKLFNERTPLVIACRSGSLECVQYLVGKGARISMHCNDHTCLMAACQSNGTPEQALQIVSYLIENEAVKNHQDFKGRTALIFACQRGLQEVVRVLLNAGADPEITDDRGWSAIFHAIDYNQLEIVVILKEAGVELNVEDKKGYKPIHVAQMKGFQDIVQLIPRTKEKYIIPSEYLGYRSFLDLLPLEEGGNPPYYPEIKSILYGSGCENLIEYFADNRMTMFDFLTTTYSGLYHQLGIEMPYERKKVLHGIYRFHSQTWSKSALNKIDPTGPFDLFDVATICTTSLKHSVILLSSHYHILINIQELNWTKPKENTVEQVRAEIKDLRSKLKLLRRKVENVQRPAFYTSIEYLQGKASSAFKWTNWIAYGVLGLSGLLILVYGSK